MTKSKTERVTLTYYS